MELKVLSWDIDKVINSMETSPFSWSQLSLSYSRISQRFMALEGLVSCYIGLVTGPYPEPAESSP
jgi:hypothetical protein